MTHINYENEYCLVDNSVTGVGIEEVQYLSCVYLVVVIARIFIDPIDQ